MELKEAIYTRRAIRAFTDKSVDEKVLQELIEAATQAPSALNDQPWSFSVIRDQFLLNDISDAAKAYLLRSTPAGLLSSHLQVLNDPKFQIFYHAPVLIVISSVMETPWAVIDRSLAAANLMLAARAEELGTCWIGFAQTWLSTEKGKAAINLPFMSVPVAPLIVGYPQSIPFSVPRKQPQVHWIGRNGEKR